MHVLGEVLAKRHTSLHRCRQQLSGHVQVERLADTRPRILRRSSLYILHDVIYLPLEEARLTNGITVAFAGLQIRCSHVQRLVDGALAARLTNLARLRIVALSELML